MTVLALDSTNPLSSETGMDLRGQLALVNSDLRPARTRLDDRNLFAPRLGIAYRVDDNTVIRTGYGIFWLPNDVAFSVAPNQDVVTTIGTPWLTSLDGGVTPFRYLNNPFPDGVLQPPGRDPAFLNTLIGGLGVRAPIPNQPLGYMQQWNFNIQRQLAGGTLVDVAYAGSKGTSLPVNAQTINQVPDSALALGTQLNQLVDNPFHGTSVATGRLSQPRVAYGQLLRPYPHFTDVAMAGPTNRSSTYHAFQAKVERRFAGGASLLASYTASKLITDAGTLTGWLDGLEGFSAQGWATGGNNNDLRALKSLAAFDVSQRFVLSYVLDLPFGKGKPIGGNLAGAANLIVGGWGINGVTTLQKGFPIGVSPSQNLSNSFGGGQFVDNNGTSAEKSGDPQTRLNEYFRTDVFSQPAAFTFGKHRKGPARRSRSGDSAMGLRDLQAHPDRGELGRGVSHRVLQSVQHAYVPASRYGLGHAAVRRDQRYARRAAPRPVRLAPAVLASIGRRARSCRGGLRPPRRYSLRLESM